MKKFFKILKYILLSLVFAICFFVCACGIYSAVQKSRGVEMPTVFGFTMATVLTGSMEPTISAGDLVIIKSCDVYYYNDVVTFYDEDYGSYVTHRIVGEEDGMFITRGDYNNKDDDNKVAIENIVGKVVCVLGGAGKIVNFLQTPAGLISVVSCVVAIFLVIRIISILTKKPSDEEQ